ncbi:hypothetical protein Cyrtocomes_00345 [Candidatus Cyrtobacter comes]|uniref:Uncharacterized protein n=1 Tax=Candidatus Cyrtobacter comes TaxID=675776 RepID=A0ABU5L7X8_9RICK|nr:hypothetical protein [Candidatus Cyrtobacter comes]
MTINKSISKIGDARIKYEKRVTKLVLRNIKVA